MKWVVLRAVPNSQQSQNVQSTLDSQYQLAPGMFVRTYNFVLQMANQGIQELRSSQGHIPKELLCLLKERGTVGAWV